MGPLSSIQSWGMSVVYIIGVLLQVKAASVEVNWQP